MNFFDILLAKKLGGGGGGGDGSADLETKTVEYTQNTSSSGDVLTPSAGKDGFSEVTVKVNVPTHTPMLETKSVTFQSNGTNNITPSSGYDGLDSVAVTVNVPTGGGSPQTNSFNLATAKRSIDITLTDSNISWFVFWGPEPNATETNIHTAAILHNGAAEWGLRGGLEDLATQYTINGNTLTLSNISGNFNIWKAGVDYYWLAC